MKILIIYLLIVNALGFLLMLADKRKARKNQWRIPETTLLTIGWVGGSLGCIIAMRLVRHKTRHLKFSVGLPFALILQIATLTVLMTAI